MPGLCAFRPWRRITATFLLAGIAEPLRDNGEILRIIENFLINAEPVAKTITRGIIPWDTARMDFGSRCLPGNEDRGALVCDKDWTGA